ncbi:YheC/YheD family protein [Metabacillus fastidiosus]|uniref:YheC/YheD family endospore coat-associated protein n=1 Tax=Metabacillus fastidiosus TaxID=1458 RepID=UPI003D29A1F6
MELVTFGFLTVHDKHEKKYATEIAKRSSHYNIQCVRFKPTNIDPSTLKVKGEMYDDKINEWVPSTFNIPAYLYDRCFYQAGDQLKKGKLIVDWLKKNPQTMFLGCGLPNKWTVYETLKKDSVLSSYFPETNLVKSISQIKTVLLKKGSCLLKPINGSRGNGIVAVYYNNKKVTAIYHKGRDKQKKEFHTLSRFDIFCESLLKQHTYLIQPLLNLIDARGYPFDIRLFLQKNKQGQWELVGKGIRKGYYGSFLSNLSGGGESISYDEWLTSLSATQKTIFESELQTICERLPLFLEENINHLFELGLDIGLAKDGSVWILDINSKPGRQLLLQTEKSIEEKLYHAPLAYCKYLSEQK